MGSLRPFGRRNLGAPEALARAVGGKASDSASMSNDRQAILPRLLPALLVLVACGGATSPGATTGSAGSAGGAAGASGAAGATGSGGAGTTGTAGTSDGGAGTTGTGGTSDGGGGTTGTAGAPDGGAPD